ncbi:hypothetical protein [Elioraea sp.]|uniref:hypothetical protein n=1 Tax=Elioraea sp. TaxID=2185103 RepID=UPI00307CF63E
MGETDTRVAWLVDIPLVKRVTEKGVVLDSELYFTRNGDSPHSTLFSSLFQRQRGLYTMIARSDSQQVVGQFRLKSDHHAHIVYVAPRLEEGADDTLWLHCLDAMAAEAGRRGAHTLIAEVDENSRLFKTLRTASFAIYARQEIWQRLPENDTLPDAIQPVELEEARDGDAHEIALLYCNIVPRLIQQIAGLPGNGQGFVYRKNERVEGYIAVAEGKSGIYMMPHLHPDAFSEATAILAGAMASTRRAKKVPVYMCVRRYQDWLEEALTELGFDICARQAFMVRHIAAGVRYAAFEPLAKKLEAIPARPPTRSQAERMIETSMWE